MWQDTRLLNMFANAIYICASLWLLGLAGYWLIHRPMFNLESITVQANHGYLKRLNELIVNEGHAHEISGNFFTIDLLAVREKFGALPWVRAVSVRRSWPNQLIVNVEEHEVLALWNQERLVNQLGEVFTANLGQVDDIKLAELSGPEGSEKVVAQRFKQLQAWLAPLGQPTVVSLSDRYAWQVTLSNGLSIDFGRDLVDETTGIMLDESGQRMQSKITELLQVLPTVEAQLGKQIAYVDLRYPNGYAVRLVEPTVTPTVVQVR